MRIFLLTLVFIFILLGCSKQHENSTKSSSIDVKEDVKIALFHHILSASFVAALIPDNNNQTCFDKAGLNPLINKRSKGPEVVDSIISGSVEFGTLAITPQAFQISQGQNLTIFATFQTSDQDIKFVGRKSAGINTPEQIKGKRIGYVGGTYGEIFLDRYLEKYKVARKNVVLTSGAPPNIRDLFLNGDLDGAILWEPVVQDIVLDPAVSSKDLFIDIDRSIYTARVNLVALPEVLKANKSKAVKLVKALICGESYLENEPKLVQTRLEEWLGRHQNSLDGVFHPETFHVTLDVENLLTDIKTETEWANSAVFNGKGLIPENFTAYINDEIMQEVAPSREVKLPEKK